MLCGVMLSISLLCDTILKTRPRKLLGSLPLVIALPAPSSPFIQVRSLACLDVFGVGDGWVCVGDDEVDVVGEPADAENHDHHDHHLDHL